MVPIFVKEEVPGKEENFCGGQELFHLRLLILYVSIISFIVNYALNSQKSQFLVFCGSFTSLLLDPGP